MPRLSNLALVAALGLLPLGLAAPQRDAGLVLRAVRFYRADQDRTRVKGLIQIPFSLLQTGQSGGGNSSYTVSVRVADSTGLALYQQSWRSRVRHGDDSNAYTVEIVDFAVAPGSYRLEVLVEDSVSGRKMSTAAEVQALSGSSRASDLLIAPQMRLASADDTVPRPGEFRTGNNLVTATARVLLTPLRANVYYLLEAYTDREDEGTLSVAIRDSAGKAIMRTEALPVTVTEGGSMLKGQLDLTGLPPGDYVLISDLQFAGDTIQRSAEFTMAGLAETLARDSARRETDRVSDEGHFAAMSAAELEEAQAPLIYIAESRELSAWSDELSLQAKRRFLTEFWKRRDPTAATPKNERREEFYRGIAYANRAYREGGRNAVAGWRSDRGRIYARNGRPDDVLRRQQEGRAPPYEVWTYASGKGYYYIFADRSGFGAFSLIHSNDLKEPGLPGWTELIGGHAVDDAGRFLGVDLSSARHRF
ncbi:MAG: GWxTD domain-containing protein [Gemmatimonadales bacterium]